MFQHYKNILYATNLNENIMPAFHAAAAIASLNRGALILLHVLDTMPDYVEGRLKGLLGDEMWIEMLEQRTKTARDALIGKKAPSQLIQDALDQLCLNVESKLDDIGYERREIVVGEGDVVDEIIAQAHSYEADLIVLGSRKGIISDNHIGTTIQSVMKNAPVPVLVVPAQKK